MLCPVIITSSKVNRCLKEVKRNMTDSQLKELMKKTIKDQFNKNGDTRQVINRLEKLTQLPNLKDDK